MLERISARVFLGPRTARSLIARTSRPRSPMINDKYRAAVFLSGATWPPRRLQNPPGRYRCDPSGERGVPVVRPETQTPEPYRTGLFPAVGYRPAQCLGEKSSVAHPAEVGAPCVRRIS